MRYRPKSAAALEIALGGLPNSMGVEAEPDLGVSAKTVGELRKTKTWPESGGYDTSGTSSRKRRKGEPTGRTRSGYAETIGSRF